MAGDDKTILVYDDFSADAPILLGNLLIVSGGVADVVEADCRDEICVGMKPISNVGESIVCMPNGVIVSVR